METGIPYSTGLALGDLVDMKTIQKCSHLSGYQVEGDRQMIRQTTAQFSLARSLKEVSDVLMIPPEYVLKVKTGVIKNDMVSECLKSIGRKDSLTVIFRISHIQERRSFPNDIPNPPTSSTAENNTEGQRPDAVAESAHTSSTRTHLVKAVELGKELVTILRLECEEPKLDELAQGLVNYVASQPCCPLDDNNIDAISREASNIDHRLTSSYFSDATLTIHYCTFHELSKYPARSEGMMKTLKSFKKRCDQLKGVIMDRTAFDTREMTCTIGKWTKGVSLIQRATDTQFHSQESLGSTNDDCHTSSYSSHDAKCCLVRVILQPIARESGSAASGQIYKATQKLYECLEDSEKTSELLKGAAGDKRFKHYTAEVSHILQKAHMALDVAMKIVLKLDFITCPSLTSEIEMSGKNLDEARTIFNKATTKLPPGSDIDLLIIGKTGHGKSCTGNSVLNRQAFHACADGDSATSEIGTAWSVIDGRVIKVVDTPGICDTRLDDNESIDLAVTSFSQAIASCDDGFHALLLILRFGTRMTKEEKEAIRLLKHFLGGDILQSHCILVMTYGDVFEAEMERINSTMNFQEWCNDQKGFMKELLKECKNRCVLFNNLTKDPTEKKKQMMELVDHVDGLKLGGRRYTNDLFKSAATERERYIFEFQLPQLRMDIVRNVQIIKTQLHEMSTTSAIITKLDETEKYVMETRENISKAAGGKANDLKEILSELLEMVQSQRKEVNKEAIEKGEEKLKKYVAEKIDHQQHDATNQISKEVEKYINERGKCFPGSSLVTLLNGGCITMSELQIGHRVLVRDRNGHLSYGTVYMFGHKDFDAFSEFIVLKTASQSVSVTKGHRVYCVQNDKEVCTTAENIQIGDCLLVTTTTGLVPQPVMTITYERKQGLFAPFTLYGTIVVDQALMSCYIDVMSASKCHALLWPIRQLYHVSPRILAFVNGSTSSHPVPLWAQFALKFF